MTSLEGHETHFFIDKGWLYAALAVITMNLVPSG